jgi:hypothetical protein
MTEILDPNEGPDMINILWDSHNIQSMSREEAYFLWDTSPNFRGEIRSQYNQLMEIIMQEESLSMKSLFAVYNGH